MPRRNACQESRVIVWVREHTVVITTRRKWRDRRRAYSKPVGTGLSGYHCHHRYLSHDVGAGSHEIDVYTAWWQKNSYPTKQKLIQKLIHGYEFFCHQAVYQYPETTLLVLFRSEGDFLAYLKLWVLFLAFNRTTSYSYSTLSHQLSMSIFHHP